MSHGGTMVSGTRVFAAVAPGAEAEAAVAEAAEILRRGGLVAFPTETVYGLGADGLNPAAVVRIFKAKGRPDDNPLILHLAGPEMLGQISDGPAPPAAMKLMEAFWPGPLTLILPRGPRVPREVTAGLDTVAVRCPAHPVARALVAALGRPVAAPSANRSGRPSPTSARDVLEDLAGRIDAVLDGGRAGVGLESTVVDATVDPPVILRPGGVTPKDLARILPQVSLARELGTVRSPGMKYAHYAPQADLILVTGPLEPMVAEVRRRARACREQGQKVAILATEETGGRYPGERVLSLGRRSDLAGVAAALFSALRQLDREGMRVIIAEGFPREELGLAIMDRLSRAAREIVRGEEGEA